MYFINLLLRAIAKKYRYGTISSHGDRTCVSHLTDWRWSHFVSQRGGRAPDSCRLPPWQHKPSSAEEIKNIYVSGSSVVPLMQFAWSLKNYLRPEIIRNCTQTRLRTRDCRVSLTKPLSFCSCRILRIETREVGDKSYIFFFHLLNARRDWLVSKRPERTWRRYDRSYVASVSGRPLASPSLFRSTGDLTDPTRS